MDTRHKPHIQPLNRTSLNLLSGHIIKGKNETEYFVIDGNQAVHAVNVQCQFLPHLSEGDQVVFCVLENGQVAVLSRLVATQNYSTSKLELAIPGIDDSFIRITEDGIHLQAGKTSLRVSKDGTISSDSRNLSQTAEESVLIKGGTVRIN
ncbi:MAG: hypothetical protein JXQ97_15815 [Natronospirillum sp.]